MTQQNISISFQLLDFEELTDEEQNLLRQAREAIFRAYAPYSRYRVGAAIRLANGTIVTGNNQENAAYPSGLCAERTAIFWAKSQFPNEIITHIAISAQPMGSEDFVGVSPCGACRQVILEYEIDQARPIKVILEGENGTARTIERSADLLPLGFSNKNLE